MRIAAVGSAAFAAGLPVKMRNLYANPSMEALMRRTSFSAAAFLLLSGPALAHHGWGSYDANNPMTITAPIEQVSLGNPHGMLMLTQDGKMWHVTLAPASRMQRRGATAELVATGKQVTAYGYPKRDGTAEIRAEWIEIDGKRIQLR
jgi:hypothetical protein